MSTPHFCPEESCSPRKSWGLPWGQVERLVISKSNCTLFSIIICSYFLLKHAVKHHETSSSCLLICIRQSPKGCRNHHEEYEAAANVSRLSLYLRRLNHHGRRWLCGTDPNSNCRQCCGAVLVSDRLHSQHHKHCYNFLSRVFKGLLLLAFLASLPFPGQCDLCH